MKKIIREATTSDPKYMFDFIIRLEQKENAFVITDNVEQELVHFSTYREGFDNFFQRLEKILKRGYFKDITVTAGC